MKQESSLTISHHFGATERGGEGKPRSELFIIKVKLGLQGSKTNPSAHKVFEDPPLHNLSACTMVPKSNSLGTYFKIFANYLSWQKAA